MKEAIAKERKRLDDKADRKFDSKDNWSIMIDKEHNEIRNNVMRKFKKMQFQKNLTDFIKDERKRVIKRRDAPHEDKNGSKPSTASTAATN